MKHSRLLFVGNPDDVEYLPRLKGCIGTAGCAAMVKPVSTFAEIQMVAQAKQATGVITTSKTLLAKLLNWQNTRRQPALDDYAGSFFERGGLEIVFIDPLKQLVTVNYSKFLTSRFISKLTEPEKWQAEIPFQWEMLDANNADRIFADYSSAFLIAVDIETFKENLAIRCIGFTAVWLDGGRIRTHSCVLPLDSNYALALARKFCWELKAPKGFQNGKYDIAYLQRYGIIVYNYLWDSANMFHSWYAELPKDLGFLGSFFVRKAMFWKDMAETTDMQQYYEYNCRDHWTTALVILYWLLEAPEWAHQNYAMEFPIVFPSILAEGTGLKRDMERLEESRGEIQELLEPQQKSLDAVMGWPVNVNSSTKQMPMILKILGCEDLPNTNEISLKKAIYRHPFIARVLNHVLEIRGYRKLKSTYLRTDADITKTSPGGSKELQGRILYAINPHGTDTGRNASREHHFWCGMQIQNIPTRDGPAVKKTVIADDGFRIAEADLKQAESRDTGYIAGDEKLIANVTGTKDFHALNASAFFGVDYSDIFDDALGKTKNKKLRDLSKRTNHGANYNMGANVLVDTMGYQLVEEARTLLGLPKFWTHKQIAEHLLEQFHRTYPTLAGLYYTRVINDVMLTRLLVGATGWTRYCFGNPRDNKRDLNSYVAHCPQSLNAMVLNKAFIKVFYEIALHPTHSKNFKLCAQIHDSILFQFRIGHDYLCDMVRKAMEIPVTVTGCDGVTRTFTVPADIKAGKDGLGAMYWSDTE